MSQGEINLFDIRDEGYFRRTFEWVSNSIQWEFLELVLGCRISSRTTLLKMAVGNGDILRLETQTKVGCARTCLVNLNQQASQHAR